MSAPRIFARVALLGACLSIVVVAGCQRPQSDEGDAARASNPGKYDQDRDYCNAQVAQYMGTRRTIDDSRNEVLRGDRDRFGQGALPSQMNAYGDSRSSDRYMSDCMAARGWPQRSKSWWERTGAGFRL
jgi:hypothetical protein